MSVRKSHKSQFNSTRTSNCETNTSDVENMNKDKTENSKTFDEGEMYFTDSEEELSPVSSIVSHYKSAKSSIKYTKRTNTYLEDSIGNNISCIPRLSTSSACNSEASDTDHEEPRQYNFSNVPSTSTDPADPYKSRKNIYYSHKVSAHTPPRRLSNKSNASRRVRSANGKKRVYTPEPRCSQMSFRNVTNTLNACSSTPAVPFRKPNAVKNKRNAANTTQTRTRFDKYAPDETGVSEIMQSDLCLKMFPVKTVPDLNCLKRDLMNEVGVSKRSTLMKRFTRNVRAIMKSKKDTDRNETDQSIPWSIDIDPNVDFDSLDALNDKLAKLELVNKTLSTSNAKREGKISVDDLDGRDSDIDFEEERRGSRDYSLRGFALPPERALDESVRDVTTNAAAGNDSFDEIRESVTSIGPLPFVADDDIMSSSRWSEDQMLIENDSLKHADDNGIMDVSAIGTPGPARELCLNDSSVIVSGFNSTHRDGGGQDAFTENRYNLRKRPRSTDHYFAPFGPSSLRAKKTRTSNDYDKNDMFFLGGTAKNKIIYRYRVRTDSIELMRKICSENDRNRPPKSKPCPCGIFPSQVPPWWTGSLHDRIHRNLHKLRFGCSEITPKHHCTVNKCNSNGYIYNILKITASGGDVDRGLESTLKNIKDFINTELGCTDNAITARLNHAIFLAVNPDSKIIGYLEVESLSRACVYQTDKPSPDYVAVKFGVTKLWVMVSYRNNGVATRLLKQFRDEENLDTKDIAFSYHRRHAMPFIKKFFAHNSTLVY